MKKNSLSFLCLLLFVGLLSSAAIAAEAEPDPEGYNRQFIRFYTDIAKYDLSTFFQTDKEKFIGFIGNDLQRFYIYFTEVTKSPDNPYQYLARGKTRVRENVCDFTGTITVVRSGRAVEQELPDHTEGFVLARVDFAEEKTQAGTGTITGEMVTDFLIDPQGVITAGDIPGTRSLQFACVWTSYKTGTKRVCNFGQGRIPRTGLPDGVWLDQGAGEFVPDSKYHEKGWKTYYECLLRRGEQNNIFCREEMRQWWTGVATNYADPVRRTYGYLSAEIPTGWTAAEEARSITFKSENGKTSVVVVAVEVGSADAITLARERATLWGEKNSALVLRHNWGFLVSTKNARRWLTVTDGWMLEIGVLQEQEDSDVRMLLHSFAINPEYSGLVKAFSVLKTNSHIESWLGSLGGPSLQGTPLPF